MTPQIVLEAPAVNRKQPLLPAKDERNQKRIGEVAGGTAAECAAVCCCCPFMLMNLLIMAVYKVPTGLCKKAWKKKKRKNLMKKKALLQQRKNKESSVPSPISCGYESDVENYKTDGGDEAVDDDDRNVAVDLEKEMWDRFYGTGFWRSPSLRDD